MTLTFFTTIFIDCVLMNTKRKIKIQVLCVQPYRVPVCTCTPVCHVPLRIFLYLYISLNQGTSHAAPDQPSAQVQVIGPSGIDDSAQAPPLRHGSVLAF